MGIVFDQSLNSSDSARFLNLTVDGNIKPGSNNAHNSGESSFRWMGVYAQDYNAGVNGNYGWDNDSNTYISNSGDNIVFHVGGVLFAEFEEASRDKIKFNGDENKDIDFIVGYNGGKAIDVDGATGNIAMNQSLFINNFYSGTNNYERLELKWDADVATIATTFDGTGSSRELKVGNISDGNYVRFLPGDSWRGYAGSTEVFKVDGAAFEVSRKIAAGSGSALDIGSSASRFRKSYLVDGNFSGTVTSVTIDNTWYKAGVKNIFLAGPNGMTMYSQIIPSADGTQTIGLTNRRFGGIHGVDGSFSGDLVTEAGGNQYIYNTYTDASNYERLEVKWDSDYAVIATAANGTGSNRTIQTSNLEIRGRTSTTETYLSLKRDNDTSVITVQSNGAGVTRIQGDHTFDVTTDTTTGTLSLGNYNGRHGVQITNEGYNVGIGRVVPAVNGVTIGRSEHPVMLNGSGTFIYNNNNVDETNYERLEFKWDTNVATIDSTAAGSGTARSFDISYNGSRRFRGDSAFSYIYQANGTYLAFGSNDFKPQQDSTIELGSTGSRWLNTYTDTITIGDGVDAVLTADAADTLALRNGTNAQQFNIYNTYTDASNYERLEIKWDTNVAVIGTARAGTGSTRELQFHINGSNRWYIAADGGFRPSADSTRTIGTNGTRVLSIFTDRINTRGITTGVETFTAASDTLDADNNVALCDCTSNAITLNLPVGVSGTQYVIKKTDATANAVTIDANGAELIDGAATQVINAQYQALTIVSDGSNWHII